MYRRLIQFWHSVTFSMLMLLAVAAPGLAASYPRHREDQWWFVAWNIENKVWRITQGTGVTVAVLDSGVNADIPELSGVVLPGIDALRGGDGRTDRGDGHGTAMAALVAAQGGKVGYLGVAPKAKILPVTMNTDDYGNGEAEQKATASGIRFAVDRGADVINMSVFSPAECPRETQEAVAYALSHDVIVVAGAGNDGTDGNPSGFPANCAGVLAVGAIDYKLRAWKKTELQPYVTVAAPGVDVTVVSRDGELYDSDGTSDASALTSGAVALVRSKYPKMSAREVVQRIIASTRDAGPPGKDDQTGYGVVRPYQALVNKVPKDAPNPVFAAYDEWAKNNGKKSTTGASSESEGSEASGLKELSSNPVVLALGGVVILGIILVLARVGRSKPTQAPVAWGPPGVPQTPQQQRPHQQFGPPSFGQAPAGGPGQAAAGWPQPPAAPPGMGAANPAPPQSPYGAPGEGRQ